MGFDTFEKVKEFVFRCKTCGEEVPSGIVNISGHWTKCTGKEFTQAIMKRAEETNGKLTELEVAQIRERYL